MKFVDLIYYYNKPAYLLLESHRYPGALYWCWVEDERAMPACAKETKGGRPLVFLDDQPDEYPAYTWPELKSVLDVIRHAGEKLGPQYVRPMARNLVGNLPDTMYQYGEKAVHCYVPPQIAARAELWLLSD